MRSEGLVALAILGVVASSALAADPQIAGTYKCTAKCDPMNGRATIQQNGAELIFKNEHNPADASDTSKGRFKSATDVVADAWSDTGCPAPLAGKLSDNNRTLRWCDGVVWTKD
jgi:hypothetical protein